VEVRKIRNGKKQTDKSGTQELWNGIMNGLLIGPHFPVPELLSSRFKIPFLIFLTAAFPIAAKNRK